MVANQNFDQPSLVNTELRNLTKKCMKQKSSNRFKYVIDILCKNAEKYIVAKIWNKILMYCYTRGPIC